MGGESFPDKSLEAKQNPFDEIHLAKDDKPIFTIEGNLEAVHLTPQEFRLLILLKRKRGGLVDREGIEAFIYGEPEGDLPLGNTVEVVARRLRLKLEDTSKGRFGLYAPGPGMGYQLTDTIHPELKSTVSSSGRSTR